MITLDAGSKTLRGFLLIRKLITFNKRRMGSKKSVIIEHLFCSTTIIRSREVIILFFYL